MKPLRENGDGLRWEKAAGTSAQVAYQAARALVTRLTKQIGVDSCSQ